MLLAFCGCSTEGDDIWKLTIRELPDGDTIYSVNVEAKDILKFYWIHSVEHIEWTETFELSTDGKLFLVESRFAGFGAGIPHDHQDGFRIEDGMMVFEPREHEVPYYDWIHSHTALPEITLNGDILLKGEDLPHHQSLRMAIEER